MRKRIKKDKHIKYYLLYNEVNRDTIEVIN